MKTVALTFVLTAFAATPAISEWRYDPSMPPAGAAIGGGSQVAMVVSCGNGGVPAFELTASSWQNPQEDFVLQVDDFAEDLYFADCSGTRCLLDMDTMTRAQAFMDQLRSGRSLSVGLYRRGSLDVIPLANSAATLDLLSQRGCGF